MSTFPVVLERPCRDRAVTGQQFRTIREAWSRVTAVLAVDPMIAPTSNNAQGGVVSDVAASVPFDGMGAAANHPARNYGYA